MSADAEKSVFLDARSYNRWSLEQIPDELIHRIFDLMKWGPTSANCSPARFVFVRSAAAKEKLAACVAESNRIKVEQAPVTAIIAYDEKFAERLPFLFPHAPDAQHWFDDPQTARLTALRNGSMQGAYFMLAARLLGLDCGPMSGFDNTRVDAEFLGGTSSRSNFLCALGHGTTEMLFPRSPRFAFDDVCRFA